MYLLLEASLYIIIIIFPILLNLFFITYKKNIKKEESKIFLNLALLISLYFSIKYFNLISNNYFYIFSTIPILLSFLYKKPWISTILIAIFIENYFYIINDNYFVILFLIVSYYILYHIYVTTEMKIKTYSFSFAIISIIYTILKTIINSSTITYEILIILSLYFLSVFLTIIFIIKSKEIMQIFMTFRDLEKENFIKVSLFKITHEIKNPLAVVKGYLDMFDVNNKEKSEKYLNIIKNEIKRTLNLLSDLNEFNKVKINKEYISFNKLLDEIKDIFISYFKENKVKYTFKTEENINILLDVERIKQVLINILKNSVEASNNGCKINFVSFIDTNKLYIFIKDNACGMEKEVLDNLFTPFYTTKDYGTGLGLCLSKEIIEAHNGLINYTSTINKGTTVKIVLPLH